MRVYELAKQLEIDSKELIGRLHKLGVEVKSHMSAVDESAIALLSEAQAPPPPEPEAAAEQPTQESAQTAEPPPGPKAAQEAGPPTEDEAAEPPADNVIRTRGAIAVKDLAEQLGVRPNQLISELMRMNVFAAINQRVDLSVARKVVEKHGFILEHEKRVAEHRPTPRIREEELEEQPEDRPEDLVPKAPVVTFLGHVDHGKTSLLDKIRNTAVVNGEYGGITQHIGAYTVEVNGRQITFLDTPGHAAFTAMRARGANLTDIAVLVVAADDGLMPQTREAIMHAREAKVALMVAINKMDLPAANADRVRQQLQEEELAPEDWGGDIICCPVSAQTGDGIDHLLEMILLQAEILELKANPSRLAKGYVIEAALEPGMGPVADLLITQGTLKIGEPVLCGCRSGRVKALVNDHGIKVKSVGPSTPVRCLGLSGVPEAGAEFRACMSDKWARTKAMEAAQRAGSDGLAVSRKASLDSLFAQLEDEEKLELKIVLKADTQGSVEAITHALQEIKSDKVSLGFALSGTGNVTANDVMLASASNAVILGFHVGKESGVDATAKHERVEIRLHQVIYELIDEVAEAMTGLLAPEIREETAGSAEIRQVFPIGKLGAVAGCLVTQGVVKLKNRVRVRRDDEVLFEGTIASLKHFQDDVPEVREAQECGIRIEKYGDIAEGDTLEFYDLREVEQTL